MLDILDTGIGLAQENMRFDENLLDSLRVDQKPILHLYSWAKPAATYGYFIHPERHFNLAQSGLLGLDLARRPTGGGIVFHIWDLAFSFFMPAGHPCFSLATLENYGFVNRAVLETVQEYFALTPEMIAKDAASMHPECGHFCMAKPTRYDVVYQGRKIAGAAQRKTRQGYLHQGTISLCPPNLEWLSGVLLSQKEVIQAMNAFSFAPIRDCGRLETVRSELQKLLAGKLLIALKS